MESPEVEIFGARYTIKGGNDPEYVRMLAEYVDEKMRAAAEAAPSNLPALKIAILAALNIADELHKSKKHQQEVEKMVRDKTGDLFDLLGPE
jgi:cell division protein ZapA